MLQGKHELPSKQRHKDARWSIECQNNLGYVSDYALHLVSFSTEATPFRHCRYRNIDGLLEGPVTVKSN